MRYGHLEKGFSLWIIGAIPIGLMVFLGMPFMFNIMAGLSLFILFFAQLWPVYHIRKNYLTPLLDDCYPDETVWLRFTRDKIFVPQFVKKSTFGATKGIVYGEKADVLDEGDFPVKTLNGNPAVIQFDMINTTIDLKQNLARRFMKKRYNIEGGVDAYNLAINEGKVMLDAGKEKPKTKKRIRIRRKA